MGISILSGKSLRKKIIIGNLSPHRGENGRRATFNLVVYTCFYVLKWNGKANKSQYSSLQYPKPVVHFATELVSNF